MIAITARIGHLGIEVSNVAASRKFYDALLGSLGFRLIGESERHAGYSDGSTQIWIAESAPRRVLRLPPSGEEEVVSEHIAFLVGDRGSVDRVSSVMERKGFSPLFPPEAHPEFSEGYYAASFEDPDHCVIEIYAVGAKKG
ncbi:MAG: VOC family protein [Candidatus Methanosuratincola petrocarbonis]